MIDLRPTEAPVPSGADAKRSWAHHLLLLSLLLVFPTLALRFQLGSLGADIGSRLVSMSIVVSRKITKRWSNAPAEPG